MNALLNTPYRGEVSRRLRKIYEQHWVNGNGKGLSMDEAEWLLRAIRELDDPEDPSALTPAEYLLVDSVVHDLHGPMLRSRVNSLGPRVSAALRRAEAEKDEKNEDPRIVELRGLIGAGRLVPAIKLYREIHGTGLLEAKAACEAMAAA